MHDNVLKSIYPLDSAIKILHTTIIESCQRMLTDTKTTHVGKIVMPLLITTFTLDLPSPTPPEICLKLVEGKVVMPLAANNYP